MEIHAPHQHSQTHNSPYLPVIHATNYITLCLVAQKLCFKRRTLNRQKKIWNNCFGFHTSIGLLASISYKKSYQQIYLLCMWLHKGYLYIWIALLIFYLFSFFDELYSILFIFLLTAPSLSVGMVLWSSSSGFVWNVDEDDCAVINPIPNLRTLSELKHYGKPTLRKPYLTKKK